MEKICSSCENKISDREDKLNGGLCDSCLETALREIANRIRKRLK